MSITDSAMLATVSISQWSARKLDKKATKDAIDANKAAQHAGRFNKSLLGRDSLAEIQNVVSRARNDFITLTLPWSDTGTRVLTAVGHPNFMTKMRAHEYAFNAAVAKLVDVYPSYQEQARVDLGEMYNAEEYPDVRDIPKRFGFRVRIDAIPQSSDFRVTASQVSEEEIAAIRADIEQRGRDNIRDAMREVFQRIAETVGHMSEKLKDYQPGTEGKRAQSTFKDSLVGNVIELVGLLPSLNLTGDPKISEFAHRMQSDLTFYDAKELREDSNARKLTADKAAAIVRDVSAFIA